MCIGKKIKTAKSKLLKCKNWNVQQKYGQPTVDLMDVVSFGNPDHKLLEHPVQFLILVLLRTYRFVQIGHLRTQ